MWPKEIRLLYWHAFIVTVSCGCLLLSAWDLLMNGLSVSTSAGGTHWGSENPVHNHSSSRQWCILRLFFLVIVQCCVFLAFVLCPIQVLHEVVNEACRNWREVLKYSAHSRRSLSSLKSTVQPCLRNGYPFTCPFFLQMKLLRSKNDTSYSSPHSECLLETGLYLKLPHLI